MNLAILVYNVFFLWEQSNPTLRARCIAKALSDEYDAIVFLEAFDDEARQVLLDALKKKGYEHATPVLAGIPTTALSPFGIVKKLHRLPRPLMNGGVIIVSKHPMASHHEMPFQATMGAERFASKGMVYACLDGPERRVHLVGLHAQANDGTIDWRKFIHGLFTDDYKTPSKVRLAQFAEVQTFLKSIDIQEGEPVIIAGDMNAHRESDELGPMLETLKAELPPGDYQMTFDAQRNDFLQREHRPGFITFLGSHPPPLFSEESEYLDYVLWSKLGATPRTARVETVCPKAKGQDGEVQDREEYDLSDHYAVAGLFGF